MPLVPESSWLDAFCPLAPASAVGFPFLGGSTSVHVCVPHDGSRGGEARALTLSMAAETAADKARWLAALELNW